VRQKQGRIQHLDPTLTLFLEAQLRTLLPLLPQQCLFHFLLRLCVALYAEHTIRPVVTCAISPFDGTGQPQNSMPLLLNGGRRITSARPWQAALLHSMATPGTIRSAYDIQAHNQVHMTPVGRC
jgi:hypothetical protein